MNYYKREIPMDKFLKYCNIAIYSKSKRIRMKVNKIIDTQIEDFFPHY